MTWSRYMTITLLMLCLLYEVGANSSIALRLEMPRKAPSNSSSNLLKKNPGDLFSKLDRDGNGKIDPHEFKALLGIGSDQPSTAPTQVPSTSPSSIPSQSFVPSIETSPDSIAVLLNDNPDDLFAKLDRDGNGKIDFDEFKALFEIGSDQPSVAPTLLPSASPSSLPSQSFVPSATSTMEPSSQPSQNPTISHVPTQSLAPSFLPSTNPTVSTHPSFIPSEYPSVPREPSGSPSLSFTPSMQPSMAASSEVGRTPGWDPDKSMNPSSELSERRMPTQIPIVLVSEVPSFLNRDPLSVPSSTATAAPTGGSSVATPQPSLLDKYPISNVPSHTTSPYTVNIATSATATKTSPVSAQSSSPSSSNPSHNDLLSSEQKKSRSEDPMVALPSLENHSGAQLMANTTFVMTSVKGLMDENAMAVFEETALLHLIHNYPRMEKFDIDFLFVNVEGQVFRFDDQVGDLTLYLSIFGIVFPHEPKGFNFQTSMELFFEVHENTLMERLETNLSKQTDAVGRNEASPPQQKRAEDEERSIADFFSKPVIIGIALTIASVVIIGALFLSRSMWRVSEEFSEDSSSPGRLGAVPSYDSSEDLLYQHKGEHSSMDQDSRISKRTGISSVIHAPSHRPHSGATGVASHHTSHSSADGSFLAGLNIQNCPSPGSSDSKQANILNRQRDDKENIFRSENGVFVEENVNGGQWRHKQSKESQQSHRDDFVEVEWDGKSTQTLSINIEHSSSSESVARQRKRRLEKRLHESKLRNIRDNNLGAGALNGRPPRNTNSVKDFIVPVAALEQAPKQNTRDTELVGERIPVVDSLQSSERETQHYERMSDVSGSVVEVLPLTGGTPDQPKKDFSTGWFRRGLSAQKPPVGLRGRSIFSRSRKTKEWANALNDEQQNHNEQTSRNETRAKRRRFGRDERREPGDESDDENNDDQGETMLLGGSISDADDGLFSSMGKSRPPRLDLRELEVAYPSEDGDVESQLSDQALPIVKKNRRYQALNRKELPSLFSQSSSSGDDPPTSAELRRQILASRRQARRSAMRQKDSPKKAERVAFQLDDSSVILGSMDRYSQLELELGSMI